MTTASTLTHPKRDCAELKVMRSLRLTVADLLTEGKLTGPQAARVVDIGEKHAEKALHAGGTPMTPGGSVATASTTHDAASSSSSSATRTAVEIEGRMQCWNLSPEEVQIRILNATVKLQNTTAGVPSSGNKGKHRQSNRTVESTPVIENELVHLQLRTTKT